MNYTLQFQEIWRNFDFFIEGIRYTLALSSLGMLIAVLLGTAVAMARNSKFKSIRGIAATYVEAIRNTPLIIQLWLFYFGLGEIGIQIPAFTCGLLTLAINTGAYTAEIIRAGFEAVDKEFKEAAVSLGMNPWQTYRTVVFPIGFRAVLPAICNMSIQCLLASALVSILGVNELTNQAMRLSNKTFRSLESFATVAVIYIILTFCFTGFFGLLNKKMAKGSLH
ncbi:MAG: amino acid ABC transporter permease [Bacillota bacterium]